jgi:hypothetical protein
MTIYSIQINNEGNESLSAAITLDTPEGPFILRVYPWTTDAELADVLADDELETVAQQTRSVLTPVEDTEEPGAGND